MRIIFLFLFLINQLANANPFVFQLKNPAISEDAFLLGSVDHNLCQSPYLISMSSMGEGVSSATCESIRNSAQLKIKIFIPIKIELVSSETLDVSFSKDSGINQFDYFSFRSIRNNQSGGGSELLGSTISMNNQSINAEIEITALVGGYGTKSFYTNTVFIDLTPIP